ncbi:hypothetical protein BKA56DRAFT_606181 [Ilyonectria sp. MPI-CAGE-AT-0026]|nr:hypothetical protein BKA56DRAFT_606181 [Ilyonectria sp. MPI-CAGE-AT-0026]
MTLIQMVIIALTGLLGSATGQHAALTHYRQDLSDGCFDAISTTAQDCPKGLFPETSSYFDSAIRDYERINQDELCTLTCHTNLIRLQNGIRSACTADSSVLKHRNVIYPTNFFIDLALFYWDISCLKDPNTGELCNSPVRQLWDTSDFSDSLNLCTDCHLETWKIYLQSPFGYDKELAEKFYSATLRCKEFANGCEDWNTIAGGDTHIRCTKDHGKNERIRVNPRQEDL